MKTFLKILFVVLLVFAFLFSKGNDFVLYFIVPVCVLIPINFLGLYVIWWFKPEWANRDWPYMTDRQRKKYLDEQERKRKAILKKWGFQK